MTTSGEGQASSPAPARLADRSTTPALWCLAAAALFGAATPAAKLLLAAVGPLTLAGLLYLGAALAVVPFARGGVPAGSRMPGAVRRLLTAVVLGGGVAPVLMLAGLARAPATSVALWLNLEVVATALVASVVFREHLDRRTLVAVAAILLAGVALAAPFAPASLVAVALVGAACVCWGVDNALTALLEGYTPAQYVLAKGALAGTVNLLLGLWLEPGPPAGAVVVAALAVGGLAYGLSLVLYVRGAQHVGAVRAQLLFATAPFLAAALAWTVLAEPLGTAHLVAAALMAGGVALMLSSGHAHAHVHAAVTHTHSHRHDDGHHAHDHPGLPPWRRHTHAHSHAPVSHSHRHVPDLHHRHPH